MAGTPTGISSALVRIEWVPGALAKCRNSGPSMAMVNALGQKYFAKAGGAAKGYKLAYHQVATKYIANVYSASPQAHRDNARNQTLAKLLP